jgi:EAL domain-containing protein (putative c-di-GMP-specific phosphodiesterase class I)
MIPVFQPIVDKEGNTLKYEVLTRLKQVGINGTEYISPFHFLDIAIKTKQYRYITRSVIRKSFEIMRDKEVDFSINLLFSDIKNVETMQYLKEQIIAYDIGHRLVLEIVESEDIKDYKLLKNVIGNFRELGVRIAIDDFGSGFSNYAYILEIAPDYLKIDGSLIKEIDSDSNAYKLVSSIQTLASSLGIKTIAEYIHSEAVFETTKKLGIDEFQGFYFSKPLDVEAFEKREALTV